MKNTLKLNTRKTYEFSQLNNIRERIPGKILWIMNAEHRYSVAF